MATPDTGIRLDNTMAAKIVAAAIYLKVIPEDHFQKKARALSKRAVKRAAVLNEMKAMTFQVIKDFEASADRKFAAALQTAATAAQVPMPTVDLNWTRLVADIGGERAKLTPETSDPADVRVIKDTATQMLRSIEQYLSTVPKKKVSILPI
jgi:hypothetical protein